MEIIQKVSFLLAMVLLLAGCARQAATQSPSTEISSVPSEETTSVPTTEETVETTAPLTGWQEMDGQWYYFVADAQVTGWQDIDGERYYFSENGTMVTGWVTIEDSRYYLNEDGKMHTGWLEWGSDRYYLLDDGSMAVGQVSIDGEVAYFTSKGKYVVLVNRWNEVPDDYQLDLVEFEGSHVDRSCVDALDQMLSACAGAGYEYAINSAYRSVEKQQSIWDRRFRNYIAAGYSEDEANRLVGQSVAIPGTSEHHLGLAVDIGGTEGILEWLAEHCWEYGFILRYPDGKTDLTGIIYEPWHFRYVGTELALELWELDLCMEEYMQILTQKTLP